MIVPFLFALDEYSKQKPTHLWIANKFYDFCAKNCFPIILQEKYTKNPKYYVDKSHSAMSAEAQEKFQYNILSDEKFLKLDKYVITKEEEKRIINKYKTIDRAAIKLLQEEDSDFEQIIKNKLEQIMSSTKDSIEAIITWIWYPSLEKVAKQYDIPVLNYELSTIRYGKYRDLLGYFKFGDKYNNKDIFENFSKFKYDSKKMLLLDRKELINLFVDDNHVDYINGIDKNPEYEVGVALGLKRDYFAQAYDGKTYDSILKRLEKFIPITKISIRSHPAMPFDESKYKYSFDHSSESTEWITKCKSIVCSVSNIGYEAILFNRGVISTNDHMITSFGKVSNLDYYDPKYYGLLELNFLTFVYYAPYELMFDLEYIRYRLKEKDLYKIYNYNQKYILKKYGLDIIKIKNMNPKDRFINILDTHDIANEEKQLILEYAFETNIEEDKRREMEIHLKQTQELYASVINSRGWKFLEKLRKIKSCK